MSLSKSEEEELLEKIRSTLTALYSTDPRGYTNAEIREELAKQGCIANQQQLTPLLSRLEQRKQVKSKKEKKRYIFAPILEQGEPDMSDDRLKGGGGAGGTIQIDPRPAAGAHEGEQPHADLYLELKPEQRALVSRLLNLRSVLEETKERKEAAQKRGCRFGFSKEDVEKEVTASPTVFKERLDAFEAAIDATGMRQRANAAIHLRELVGYLFRKARPDFIEACNKSSEEALRMKKASAGNWVSQGEAVVAALTAKFQAIADKHPSRPPREFTLPPGLLDHHSGGDPPVRKSETRPPEQENTKELAEAILKLLPDYGSNGRLPSWARDIAARPEEERMPQLMGRAFKELEDLNVLLTELDVTNEGNGNGSPLGGPPPYNPGAGATSYNSQEARLREQLTQANDKCDLIAQELEKLKLKQKELTEAWETLKPGCGGLTVASLKDALENVVSGQVHMRTQKEVTDAKVEVTRLEGLLRGSVQKEVHDKEIAAKDTEIETLKKAQTAPVSRWWRWGWKPTTTIAVIAAVVIASTVYVNLPDASPARKPVVSAGKKGISRAEFQRRLTQMETTRKQSSKTSK